MNQLAALALLAGAAAGREDEVADGLRATAELLGEAIPELEAAVDPIATAFAYVGRMYVIGRGVEFGTAREIALKLTETCRVAAEPLTSTDLAHGPIAALDAMFPVWTIASPDESLSALVEAASRARAAGATLVASGSAASEIEGAAWRLPVPKAPHALLSPLLSVVPGQLFAAALAQAKGLDAEVGMFGLPGGDQLGNDRADRVRRNREAHALVSAGLAVDLRVDAHHAALRAEERPPGVAVVDGCVGLDRVGDRELVRRGDRPMQRADDPARDGLGEPERAPDRDHAVAHLHCARVAERERVEQ